MEFYDKLMRLLNERGMTKNKLLTELKLNRNSIQNWQSRGTLPKAETIKKIADYFNVSTESLVDDSMDIEYFPSTNRSAVTKLFSYYQRTLCVRGKYEITPDELDRISNCVNANPIFLFDRNAVQYNPELNGVKERADVKVSDLFAFASISDRCSDNEMVKTLMIQCSRVILYRVSVRKAECTDGNESRFDLYSCKHLMPEKLDFLYTNKASKNPSMNFGFYFTEIDTIHEHTGLSFEYLISGLESE